MFPQQGRRNNLTDNFIACLENSFHYFGGVPKRVVIDNLKAAVPQADWYDPELNPKLQSFAAHYGTAVLPTRPYRLRTLRQLLKRSDINRQVQFDFIEEHPIIRPLSDYSLDSLNKFRKERRYGQRDVV